MLELFCEQFQYLRHVTNAVQVVGELCDRVFNSAEVLNTNPGSRLFRSFVYVNPVACAKALLAAFGGKTKEALISVNEGRRNLIWALEKLCFRNETFDDSIMILSRFAIAENENIANNATHQFLQLFHTFLPGTEVDLKRRWSVVEKLLKGTTDERLLAFSAIKSILGTDYYTRMGGAEEQGEVLIDYKPTTMAEITHYRENAIGALGQFLKDTETKKQAIDLVQRSFFLLSTDRAGHLILPVIQRLYESGDIEKIEFRRIIQRTLNSGKVQDSKLNAQLEKIFDELTPVAFEERFKAVVQNPSTDDYYPTGMGKDRGVDLDKRVKALAAEFISDKRRWIERATLFFQRYLAEGHSFGVSVGSQLNNAEDVLELEEIIFNEMLKVEPEIRNFSVPIGVLVGLKNDPVNVAVYNRVLNDKVLKDSAFVFARNFELPYVEIEKLVVLSEKGIFSPLQFNHFEYGWGIKHLPKESLTEIFSRIRKLGIEGATTVFATLAKMARNNEEFWETYKPIIRDVFLKDTAAVMANMKTSMDFLEWDGIAIKLLNKQADDEVAFFLINYIIDQSDDPLHFHSKEHSFFKILDILEDQYFMIFWQELSSFFLNPKDRGIAVYNLRELLGSKHDFMRNSVGILFKGSEDHFKEIIEWSAGPGVTAIGLIANMLPVFNSNPAASDGWHPYASEFIERFGDNPEVLQAISAKLHSFGWMGTVIPRLESEQKMYASILESKNENVKRWSEANIQELDARIKWEHNREEDGLWEP